MKTTIYILAFLTFAFGSQAGWLDQLLGGGKAGTAGVSALSVNEMTRGLK